MITLNQIQEKLAQAIRQSKMTQTEIARQLKITPSSISHYVIGDKMPALDTLANLCKILDISSDYILCLDDNK